MAVLEFEFKGIDQNFRSSASNVLNDIDKIKKAFSSIGVGIGVDLKTALYGQKVALNDTKIQTQELVKAGKELDNQNKQTRNSIAELTLEQKKLTAEQRASRANLQDSPYSKLSRELNEMRNEAKNLGAQMILLDNAGMKTSSTYNTLENRFKQVQKETLNLDNSIKKLDSDLGQNNRRVGAYGNALGGLQQKQSGANGVAMEFNRIIQDAPYGMMGIGNNIQQLAANWQTYTEQAKAAATANGTTVTSMSLVKGAISSILSPANLLTLGIAAVTSGWTFYTMQAQKANKATKDNKSEMDKLKESLSSFQKVQLNGVNNYAQEIAKLQTLYKVATNVSESTKARTNALRQLQEMYPKVFSNLDLDTIKTDKVSSKYKELSSSIIAAARAQAAFTKMSELSGDDFTLISKAIDNQKIYYDALAKKNALQKEWNKLQKENPSAGTANYYIQAIDRQNEIMKSAVKTAKEINRDRINIGKEQERYSTYSGTQQEDIVDLTGKEKKEREKVVKNIKEQFDYLAKIRDLLGDKQEKVAVLDLKGEQKELKELEFSYVDFFNKLTDLQNKLSKDKSVKNKAEIQEQINNARKLGEKLKESQRELIESKWIEERTKLIDEMYGKLEGVAQTPLEKKFADWAKEVEKFKNAIIDTGNPLAQFQSTLDELTEKGNFLISAEEGSKNLKEWQDNNDKIAESINKPFGSGSQKKLQQEMQKRLRILEQELIKQQDLAQKYFTDYKASDLTSFLTEIKGKWQLEIDAIVNAEQAKKDIQDYVTIANNGLNSVFTNLKSNIDEFGLKARSVFYTLGESLGGIIDQLKEKNMGKFMKELTKTNEEGITNIAQNWKEMNKDLKISAGLGYAGGVVQSFGGSFGNVLGGGLSGAAAGLSAGAATGAAGGGAYGAVIGAVVGMTAGILKEAKNRRQEKILIKQMEEQKKANRFLERMSALSYASQIIGQKTEYGIVSGVRRNEFGQIVSVVQGQDIIMVADRTNKQKGR